jgi:hypothetical protein
MFYLIVFDELLSPSYAIILNPPLLILLLFVQVFELTFN